MSSLNTLPITLPVAASVNQNYALQPVKVKDYSITIHNRVKTMRDLKFSGHGDGVTGYVAIIHSSF